MTGILAKLFTLLVFAAWPASRSFATGYYGPSEYLSQGGKNVVATPEFYWELEVKRLSKDFHPTEKFHGTKTIVNNSESDNPRQDLRDQATAEVDDKDFTAALKEGRIKPPDPGEATEQNNAARTFILSTNHQTTGPLPEEFNSEFADYHRGACAFRRGEGSWEDARKAWEGLLNRPAVERHDRSVWAAFMLGKLALKKKDPEAVKWFQMTRQLARDGFSDSLGMAADSYGWEGRSEWKQGHPEKAAPLFLTQLALGDESAVISLKALIPDRVPIDGMLNYGVEPDELEKWNDEQKKAAEQKTLLELKAAVADPLLRRLVTAHILATESNSNSYWSLLPGQSSGTSVKRSSRWLSVIKEAKPDRVDDAEYLGWVAYGNGDYKEAARWLELAKPDSPAACWLRSKLQLRAGKLDDAVKSLSEAIQTLRSPAAYTGWNFDASNDACDQYSYNDNNGSWPFPQSANGDLAQLHLARGDFIQTLDIFWKGGLWDDAAYVAERVLTADELKAYVDKQPILSGSENMPAIKETQKLRYLLGRRLVREDRYSDAGAYLTPPYDKILERYVKALKDGANEKLPKLERARAWFAAGWMARYDGMELMGTEVSPDGFDSEGSFENTNIAKERLSGKYATTVFENNEEKSVVQTIPLKPSKQEVQRLEKNMIRPDVRYHYRIIAGALAVKAAPLLGDNTDELADVVNTAGNWVKDRGEKIADRYYQILEKRCAKTKTGQAAIARRWFVDAQGPWSDAQKAAYDAMHAELGGKTVQE